MEEMGAIPPSQRGEYALPGGLAFVVRRLIRGARRAALGTVLAGEARCYVSLVAIATDIDGAPLMLLSRLSDHSRNIDADNQISLLVDGTEGFINPQAGPRVTLLGRVETCSDERVRRRFLTHHPAANLYAGFADFACRRVRLERAHWVGGFGRAQWISDGLLVPPPVADAFIAAEASALARLNEGHGHVAIILAHRLLKRRGQGWRIVGLDPDGCDLARSQTVLRLSFDAPAADIADAERRLIALAEQKTALS